ncbi:hypothetical protein EHS25_002278 [Saitozyma podzolica]|uniref:Uncharacterized protein n=1 Tax=Saitozyma podzolica TaxID=1890683 RepID=A0A427YDL1_9TREE|nr:hypothetical protein EHS25_002278 [Saitozyma podzolica]
MSPPEQLPIMALLEQPLAHDPKYCLAKQSTLHLKKRMMSLSSASRFGGRGDYTLLDDSSEPLFKCTGKVNMKQEKSECISPAITNPDGDVVVTLLTRAMSMVQETVAKTPAEQEVFRVRLDTKTMKHRVSGDLVDSIAGKPVHATLIVRNGWKCHSMVEIDGECVGYVYRDKWTNMDHKIELAANMDYVFVASLIILLDIISVDTLHTVV